MLHSDGVVSTTLSEHIKIMNNSKTVIDLQYIRGKINEFANMDLQKAQAAFIELLKEYSIHFSPNSIDISCEVLENLFTLLFDEFRRLTNLSIEFEEYRRSCFLFRQFETTAMYARVRKLMSFNSWLEYHYDLCMMLHITYHDIDALHRIDSLIGTYASQKEEVLKRIREEDDLQLKSISDLSYFYSYLINHCLLAIVVCNKTGNRHRLSKFMFYEKLLTEKLHYTKDELNYEFQFAGLKRRYFFTNEIGHSVLNPRNFVKGWKLRIMNTKYFAYGLLYSLLRITTGFGEKPQRLLIVSLIIVFVFSTLFSFLNVQPNLNPFSYWFESLTIFSTFGLMENTLDMNLATRIAVAVEILLGILCMNGFIVLLARKYLR